MSAAGATARQLPPPGQPPLGPWPGRHVIAREFRLHVRRVPHGAGSEPAVFVHGLGGSATNWTDLAYLLADRLDGHCLDLPGFGYSDPPPTGVYSLDTHVRAVVGYIREHLDGAPVHLFGNSLGGAVSTRVAAEYPELVRTLTLVAPALPDLRPRRPPTPAVLALAVPGVERLARVRPPRIGAMGVRAEVVLELVFADPARIPPERLAEAEADVRRRLALPWALPALVRSGRGLAAAYVQRGRFSLWRQARCVSAPTLLVFGRQDRLVSVRIAPRAARAFRDNRLLVLDDCGHVPQMEHPEVVAAAVRELLSAAAERR